MRVGDLVELHSRFTDTWEGGFEVAGIVEAGYRVRRRSDKSLLPDPTSESDLRLARS